MFDLAYPLEESVTIDGNKYTLNLAFDNVLRLIDMLEDEELSPFVQINTGLYMLIGIDLDIDIKKKEEVFYRIFKSTIGIDVGSSQPVDIEGNPMPQARKKEVYSLKEDAEYIFASFMSDYGIDLFEQHGKLHWAKFKALLGGLTEGSKFLRVIEIRTAELPKGKGTEKQRKQMLELKQAYALKGEDIEDE